jgi:hypothetical protein
MSGATVVDRPGVELARWSVGTLLGMLAIAAVVLFGRRLAEALDRPLPPAALLGAGMMVATAALGARVLWHHVVACSPQSKRLDRLIRWFTPAAVLAVGAALSLPDTSPSGLVALWGVLIVGEGCAALPAARRRWLGDGQRLPEQRLPPSARRVRVDPAQTPSPHAPDALTTLPLDPLTEDPLTKDALPGEVTQQLVRSRAADGSDVLSGRLRVELAPGGRTASVHVAFCPPFGRTPNLEVRQLDGPDGRIKTAQLLPYGARFDLKLAQPSEEPSAVLLQFTAASKPSTESGEAGRPGRDPAD